MPSLQQSSLEKRNEALEKACARLITFPGMKAFVGDLIYKETVDLLRPQDENEDEKQALDDRSE